MKRQFALFLLVGSLASGLSAQTAAPSWGTTSESVLSINAWAFDPLASDAILATNGAGSRYFLNGGGFWFAPISLPTGALITGLELQGCDSTDLFQLRAVVQRRFITGAVDQQATVGVPLDTGVLTDSGCQIFSVTFPTPEAVDNSTQTYDVSVSQDGIGGGVLRFAAVRLRYRLQVSPAPVVATFPADVPTGHPFFQFVEALAAAGITAGCGPQQFCPDGPLTRGQMAVFLSVALGLHFPN